MAENPCGDRQGVVGEVNLSQGIDTPGVEELPRGGKNLRGAHQGRKSARGRRMGAGKGRKNPFHPRNQGAQSQRQQRGNDVWSGDGCGQIQRMDPSRASQRRQAQKRHAITPRVHLTGARGAGGRSSYRGDPGNRRRPRGHKLGGRLREDCNGDEGQDREAHLPSARHVGGQR